MSFKIVQTIENRVPKLTVVPTLWETNGIVRWPPKNIKYASKLIKDRDSRPGPEWDSFECVLKRNYIPTYEEANKELSQMEQNTDTDYDNDNYSFQQMARLDHANKHLIDFEVMAQNLDNLRSCANASTASTINVCDQQQDTIHVYSSQEIQTVINNQNLILKSLETFVKVQKQLVSKMADFSVQLEETKTSITQEKDRPVNVTLVQDSLNTEENESFCMTPIENQQQLEMLETNLADKTYN